MIAIVYYLIWITDSFSSIDKMSVIWIALRKLTNLTCACISPLPKLSYHENSDQYPTYWNLPVVYRFAPKIVLQPWLECDRAQTHNNLLCIESPGCRPLWHSEQPPTGWFDVVPQLLGKEKLDLYYFYKNLYNRWKGGLTRAPPTSFPLLLGLIRFGGDVLPRWAVLRISRPCPTVS